MTTTELHDSELGCKEYWDKAYVRELANFQNNDEDHGEIWFGEHTERKIVDWLTDNIPNMDISIADLGTGNGHLLSELAEEGFNNLTGIDYSPSSIELARAVNEENPCITFLCRDLLQPCSSEREQFDICIDKGTYDAISLSPTSATDRQTYKTSVCTLLSSTPSSRFVLASVNWTVPELTEFFGDCFHVDEVLPSREFTFGGVTGKDVSMVVFRHRDEQETCSKGA
eukprot:sb/3469580/